jgi:hypothetical protein
MTSPIDTYKGVQTLSSRNRVSKHKYVVMFLTIWVTILTISTITGPYKQIQQNFLSCSHIEEVRDRYSDTSLRNNEATNTVRKRSSPHLENILEFPHPLSSFNFENDCGEFLKDSFQNWLHAIDYDIANMVLYFGGTLVFGTPDLTASKYATYDSNSGQLVLSAKEHAFGLSNRPEDKEYATLTLVHELHHMMTLARSDVLYEDHTGLTRILGIMFAARNIKFEPFLNSENMTWYEETIQRLRHESYVPILADRETYLWTKAQLVDTSSPQTTIALHHLLAVHLEMRAKVLFEDMIQSSYYSSNPTPYTNSNPAKNLLGYRSVYQAKNSEEYVAVGAEIYMFKETLSAINHFQNFVANKLSFNHDLFWQSVQGCHNDQQLRARVDHKGKILDREWMENHDPGLFQYFQDIYNGAGLSEMVA